MIKMKWHTVLTIFFSLLMFGIFFFNVFNSFKDTTTVLEGYCEHSGGEWNFYECYNQPLVTPSCAELKTGYWCDYPDGTSKSENEIEYELNSTTTLG